MSIHDDRYAFAGRAIRGSCGDDDEPSTRRASGYVTLLSDALTERVRPEISTMRRVYGGAVLGPTPVKPGRRGGRLLGMQRSLTSVAVLLTVGLHASGAQSLPNPRDLPIEHFEVISIRRSATDARGGGMQPNGRFNIRGTTLSQLLIFAYDGVFVPERIVGVPDWAARERFDIVATAANSQQDARALLRGLLADRFEMRSHVETRNVQVYVMTVASIDGSTRRGLRPQALDCTNDEVFRRERERASANGSACGSLAGRDQLRMRSATLNSLATVLASRLGQPVVNRTGITGRVDIDMSWDPTLSTTTDPAGDRAGLFTAVQEQLGLRLQSQRELIDVLVLDNVARPMPN